MPKVATKNVDRYKVRGGELNEFDFHQNQQSYADQQAKKVSKAAKGTKRTNEKESTAASAKKPAAKKAARKSAKKPAKKK